jgi:hypothetical protein
MQNVQILNATASTTSIRGLGAVLSGVVKTGYINQITFDDDFVAYKDRASKAGILVRDVAAGYTPAGYNAVTAIETLVAADRFAAVNSTSGAYALTLMAANAVPANTVVYFFHETGGNTVTITRAGADTINGGTTLALNTANPVRRLKSDGVSAWTSV